MHRIRSFFQHARHGQTHALLLEGGDAPTGPLNRWTIIGLQPRQVIRIEPTDPIPPSQLFAQLDQALTNRRERLQHLPQPVQELPFTGGLMGVLGYGFQRFCDPAFAGPSVLSSYPDLLLIDFEDILLWDLTQPDPQPIILSPSPCRYQAYLDLWQELPSPLGRGWPKAGRGILDPDLKEIFTQSLLQPQFEQAVLALLAAIQRGEIYQANLSMRFEKRLRCDPFAIYHQLCQSNPSPFSGYLLSQTEQGFEEILVCNSPERLLKLGAGGRLNTRPIAGTRGRGKDSATDHQVGQSLSQNPKEQAEHRMLVDLARNDLGRVCEPGSVQVDELLILERYSHVTHLVSNVTGQKAHPFSNWDALKAVFPGGTITGCPKIRSVQHLNALEPVPRGWYTGSLGYIDARTGAMDWNILIRSLYLQADHLDPQRFGYNGQVHAGAGIVADSVPEREYQECLKKAAALFGVLAAHDAPSPSFAPSASPGG